MAIFGGTLAKLMLGGVGVFAEGLLWTTRLLDVVSSQHPAGRSAAANRHRRRIPKHARQPLATFAKVSSWSLLFLISPKSSLDELHTWHNLTILTQPIHLTHQTSATPTGTKLTSHRTQKPSPQLITITMATDYAKRKNDDLAALCKERGLSHTGKKADLVKRLEDYDASNTTSTSGGIAAAPEDEIDWDDEPATETAKSATTAPAADALAAGGIGEIPNPQQVPNQIPVTDPAATDDLSVDPPAATTAEAQGGDPEMKEPEPEKDFSTGLADRTIEEEIEKRKARARKFGLPEDSDEIKALERAKRFGNADVPGLLNKALPNERERRRGRDGAGAGDGGVQKRGRGGRPGMGGRRGSGRREKERTPIAAGRGGGAGAGGGSLPGWMSKEDREAVERRKAKFGAGS